MNMKDLKKLEMKMPAREYALNRLWVMRIIVHLLRRNLLREGSLFANDELAIRAFELLPEHVRDALPDPGEEEPDRAWKSQVLECCRDYLATLERMKDQLGLREPLATNLAWFCDRMGLNETERRILTFACLCTVDPDLHYFASEVDRDMVNPRSRLHRTLALVFDLQEREIGPVLRRNSRLVRSGFIGYDCAPVHLLDVFDEISEDLVDALVNETCSLEDRLASTLLHRAPEPVLEEDHYRHCRLGPRVLSGYLEHASREGRHGVNLLIHGPPGTGKTELARLVASLAGLELVEVPNVDSDGDGLRGAERLMRYQVSQIIFGNVPGRAILFDEAEDVFPADHASFLGLQLRGESRSKAWFNDLLENSPVPAIWVCNTTDGIDPAWVRRFDLVVELDVPPLSIRKAMLSEMFSGLPVSDHFLHRMAGHRYLTPALLTRARLVLEAMPKSPEASVEQRLEDVLNGWLEAMGHPPLHIPPPPIIDYHPDLIHTDQDVSELAEGLRVAGFGRLFFYGPPGTGKTAFAHHLARLLGRELHVWRASDLLDPFVGMTEKSIARMFREAEREGAVLLIDEADSLLRSRDHAVRSWEVTQVNEMLTRMEDFDGYLIVSTNFENTVDLAAMRRFDFRIRFSPLTPNQAVAFAERILAAHDCPMDEHGRSRLRRLEGITPGDFGAVMRRLRIAGGRITVQRLLTELERELAYRAPGHGIGFHAAIA